MCFELELSVLIIWSDSSSSGQFLPSFCLFSVTGACFPFPYGGSWLGCQDLPALGAVSIQELADFEVVN